MVKTPVQIRFNDIDILGHINNVMFGHYCDMARSDFIFSKISPKLDFQNDDKVLIMVHTEYDFLASCFFTDILSVETSLEKIGEKSLHLLQEIVDEQGNVRVRSRSVMSTFDKSTGKSFPIKDEWEFFEQ